MYDPVEPFRDETAGEILPEGFTRNSLLLDLHPAVNLYYMVIVGFALRQ